MMENKHLKENRFVELRALEDGNMVLEGYALTFENPATHNGYTEVIDRGALANTDMSDVCMKYNHEDTYMILARTRNNSLQLKVDDVGLWFRAELIDTTSNVDVYKSIQSRLIDKCSFAFTVDREEYDYDTDTRRILSIDKLFDVSVVDVPFYDDTLVVARSKDSFIKEKEQKQAQEVEFNKKKLNLLLSL
jgi:HK97 family phage prohead protease